MPIVYKDGEEKFIYPIDLPGWIKDGWKLNPPNQEIVNPIAINSATAVELKTRIPGLVRMSQALKIIKSRPYQSIEELVDLDLPVDWKTVDLVFE